MCGKRRALGLCGRGVLFGGNSNSVILILSCRREALLAVVFKCLREWCFAPELQGVPRGPLKTHESIGHLWRVKPKQDVNGLKGRLKP
jgi:hypothetical protein